MKDSNFFGRMTDFLTEFIISGHGLTSSAGGTSSSPKPSTHEGDTEIGSSRWHNTMPNGPIPLDDSSPEAVAAKNITARNVSAKEFDPIKIIRLLYAFSEQASGSSVESDTARYLSSAFRYINKNGSTGYINEIVFFITDTMQKLPQDKKEKFLMLAGLCEDLTGKRICDPSPEELFALSKKDKRAFFYFYTEPYKEAEPHFESSSPGALTSSRSKSGWGFLSLFGIGKSKVEYDTRFFMEPGMSKKAFDKAVLAGKRRRPKAKKKPLPTPEP